MFWLLLIRLPIGIPPSSGGNDLHLNCIQYRLDSPERIPGQHTPLPEGLYNKR